MTFPQWRSRLMKHFSECTPVVRQRMTIFPPVLHTYSHICHWHNTSWHFTVSLSNTNICSTESSDCGLVGLQCGRYTLSRLHGVIPRGPQTWQYALFVILIVGMWLLVALDLQNCGVGNTGGKAALEMLHSNTRLEIVDLRGNQNISCELLTQIMRQLHVNNKGVPLKVMAEWLHVTGVCGLVTLLLHVSLRFSEWCILRFLSSGMWHCIAG